MARVRGGGSDRGFRGRGRRGRYPRRSHSMSYASLLSMPLPHSVSSSTNSIPLNAPADHPFAPSLSAVKIEGSTTTTGRQLSPTVEDSTFVAESSVQAAQSVDFGDARRGGILTPGQTMPASIAQQVSPKHLHTVQQHHEQVERSTLEQFQTQPAVAATSATSDPLSRTSVSVDTPGREQDTQDGSSSPTDLYLYGPNSNSGPEQESVLGKRKHPTSGNEESRRPTDIGEEVEGEGEGEELDSDAEHKDGPKKAKVCFCNEVWGLYTKCTKL